MIETAEGGGILLWFMRISSHLSPFVLHNRCQVGGIKEKVLAAHRAGIRHVLLPKRNEKDLCELHKPVKVGCAAAVAREALMKCL